MHGVTENWWCSQPTPCYVESIALNDPYILGALSRMPFVDTAELAMTLGEARSTVHRGRTGLLTEDMVGRVSHGTAHMPSSRRTYLCCYPGSGLLKKPNDW